jgi:hypothetical protein
LGKTSATPFPDFQPVCFYISFQLYLSNVLLTAVVRYVNAKPILFFILFFYYVTVCILYGCNCK